MNLLVSDGLISLHVQKEGTEHLTKCITMKRGNRKPKRPAPPPPQTPQDGNEYSDYDQVRWWLSKKIHNINNV